MPIDELSRRDPTPPRPGGALHLDATMGAAGDMLVGALLDLGLPDHAVRRALVDAGLRGIGPRVTEGVRGRLRGLHVSFVDERGVPLDAGTLGEREPRGRARGKTRARQPSPRREQRTKKVTEVARALDLDRDGVTHGDHGMVVEQRAAKRAVAREVEEWRGGALVEAERLAAFLGKSRLAAYPKALALKALRRYLDGRAQASGRPLVKLTLDGPSALDALADIVGTMALVEALEPSRISVSAVAVSSAAVVSEGQLVPGPSTWVLANLGGLRVVERDLPWECTTPTAAALLWTLQGPSTVRLAAGVTRVGTGLGTRDVPGTANVTRALYAERAARASAHEAFAVDALVDGRADRPALAQALERAGATAISFARVEDERGAPQFRVQAHAPVKALDEVAKALRPSFVAPFITAGTLVAWPADEVTLSVGRGKKSATIRARVRPDGGPPLVDAASLSHAAAVTGRSPDELAAWATSELARLQSLDEGPPRGPGARRGKRGAPPAEDE